MSTLTPILNLFKPDLSDPADITAMNSNWDKIEESIQGVANEANGINRHWWKRRTESSGYALNVSSTPTSFTVDGGYVVYYGDSVTTSGDKITISNVQSVSAVNDNLSTILADKYFAVGAYQNIAKVHKAIGNASVTRTGNMSDGFAVTIGNVYACQVQYYENNGEYEYVSSSDRNAYPDSGADGIFVYQYLGIPFENAREGASIEQFSYVGTGTYGASNPTSVTFDKAPKIVMMVVRANAGGTDFNPAFTNSNSTLAIATLDAVQTTYQKNSGFYGIMSKKSEDGRTLYWYYTDANYQLNNKDYTYYGVAFF